MLVSRRFVLSGVLAVAGCQNLPPSPDEATLPIALPDVFAGRLLGWGHYRIKHVRTEYRFDVRMSGQLQGDRIRASTEYIFDESRRHRLDWALRRAASDRWVGETDPSTEAVETGREIRMRHQSGIFGPEGIELLGFEDVIYRRADGRFVIDSVVARGGTPVANMRIVLVRT